MNYRKFIESRLKIINKDGKEESYTPNVVQSNILDCSSTKRIELKARQQGVSSINLAKRVPKFTLMENRYILTIADNADNAQGLLQRVKYFLKTYSESQGIQIPLKYNSKYELYNEALNSWWVIGTAENVDVGRSKTITDLIMSEAAFFKNFRKLLASALQAVVPDGEVDIETTANGFNEFKEFWDESILGNTGFTPLFYAASLLYTPEFLEQKKKELGSYFSQEYPETALEAFLHSGNPYFDSDAMKFYLDNSRIPMTEGVIY